MLLKDKKELSSAISSTNYIPYVPLYNRGQKVVGRNKKRNNRHQRPSFIPWWMWRFWVAHSLMNNTYCGVWVPILPYQSTVSNEDFFFHSQLKRVFFKSRKIILIKLQISRCATPRSYALLKFCHEDSNPLTDLYVLKPTSSSHKCL